MKFLFLGDDSIQMIIKGDSAADGNQQDQYCFFGSFSLTDKNKLQICCIIILGFSVGMIIANLVIFWSGGIGVS